MSPDLNFQVVPLAEVPVAKPLPSQERQQPVVLVVDDERVIADTLSVILSRSGFSVATAYEGESALELAKVTLPDMVTVSPPTRLLMVRPDEATVVKPL